MTAKALLDVPKLRAPVHRDRVVPKYLISGTLACRDTSAPSRDLNGSGARFSERTETTTLTRPRGSVRTPTKCAASENATRYLRL